MELLQRVAANLPVGREELGGTMKILAISDRVVEDLDDAAIGQRFADVDLVLACGDLPFHYLEAIAARLGVPMFYVLGNHDQGIHTASGLFKKTPAGCANLDERAEEVKGLLMAGLEGSMRYTGEGEHQYSDWDMWIKALRLSPALCANRVRHGRFLDVLITHAPPYQIHDGPDLCHTGFKAFRWLMDLYRPRYLVHGHQHLYGAQGATRTTYRHTEVVNAYGYQIIQWDSGRDGAAANDQG